MIVVGLVGALVGGLVVTLPVVESDTNALVVLRVVESDSKAFKVLTSLAKNAELPVLLLLVLDDTDVAETGARFTVFVTKSADVNLVIVVLTTTAKNSPDTLWITALAFAVFVPLPWLMTRSLNVSAPDKPKISAPSVKSSTVSAFPKVLPPSPTLKTKMSPPSPPVSLSAPRPPCKTSSPNPPMRVSLPEPPTKVSAFTEPVSTTATELLALLTIQPLEPVTAARLTLNPADCTLTKPELLVDELAVQA